MVIRRPAVDGVETRYLSCANTAVMAQFPANRCHTPYSSHLRTWKGQREDGALEGLTPKKRGRKAKRRDPVAEENQRLRREKELLEHRLQQAETIIDVQKKLCTMLGLPHATDELNENEE